MNLISAFIFGILAAAYWVFLFLRRVLRREPYANLTKAQKLVPVTISIIAFVPALFCAYALSFLVGKLVLAPGPAVHLVMSFNLALCMSILGSLLTFLAGYLPLYIIGRVTKNA